MDTTTQGTDATSSQVAIDPNAAQQTQQASTQTQQPAVTQTGDQTTTQQPSPADLQRQIAELNQKYQVADQSAKYFQSQFDKQRQQAMQALAGTQPQADPLKPHVDNLVSKGYEEKDARAIVEAQYSMVQPLMQQNQQLQAAIQGNAIVGDVLREGWGKAPQLFSDPQILQSVEQVLRAEALRGNQINAEYAIDLAFVAEGRKRLAGGQQHQAPPQQVPPNIPGQFGWTSGFGGPPQQQAQQQQQQLSSELLAAKAALEARYGISKQA